MARVDREVDVVLYDSDYGLAANIIKNLYLGPGEPGPGDEWKMPPLHGDGIVPADDQTDQSAAGHLGRLHWLIVKLVGE